MLNIPMGSSSETSQITEYVSQANGLAIILNNGLMPIVYNATTTNIEADITSNNINIAIYCLAAILAIGLIYLIITFKLKGLIVSILQVGYISVFLLILRYIQMPITLDGIARNYISYNNKLLVCIYDIEKFK